MSNDLPLRTQVEVWADNLSTAHISQLHDHDDADISHGTLSISRRVRNLIQERLHQYGSTPAKVLKGSFVFQSC